MSDSDNIFVPSNVDGEFNVYVGLRHSNYSLFLFFVNRKTILDYFGEDTSSLEPYLSCCDNCDRGSNYYSEKQFPVLRLPAPVRQDFTVNRTVLSQILLQVRDAIATAKRISNKDSIANAVALSKMANIPPQNFDEFRSLGLDDFFGPTFVNAVDMYLVSIIYKLGQYVE